MNDRPAGLWIVLLVAFAGMLHVVPGAPGNGAESSPPAAARAEGNRAEPIELPDPCTGIGLVSEFWGANHAQADVSWSHHVSDALIVTIADPIDSHVAFNFDERMEAIQRAAERLNYVSDRHCLPWPRKWEPDSASTATGDHPIPPRRPHHNTPGVLLFRHEAPIATNTELLVIFLVGETPTSGVHKEALYSALQQTYELLPESKKIIRVVGPSFSGSAVSMALTVHQWAESKDRRINVHVISSNATSPDIRAQLTESNDRLQMEFHSVVWSDDELGCAAYKSLAGMGVPANRILVLSEASSAYGQQLGAGHSTCPDYTPIAQSFPMHIAQLSSAYQRNDNQRHQPIGPLEDPRAAALALSFDQPAAPLDISVPFTPGPTTNIADLTISRILYTISHEKIRAIGIFATDTRDKLFLAELIRSRAPDVRLFTSESDILYTHPHYLPSLYGMLIVSSYPLVPQTRFWKSDKMRFQFSSQGGQGTFNAILVAADKKCCHSRLYGQSKMALPGPESHVVDYFNVFGDDANPPVPPIWVSAVGSETVWPLSVSFPTKDFQIDMSQPLAVSRSRSFLAIILMMSGVGIGSWFYFTRVVYKGNPPAPPRKLSPGEKILTVSYFAILLVAYLIFAFVVFFPFGSLFAADWAQTVFQNVLRGVSVVTVVLLIDGLRDSIFRRVIIIDSKWFKRLLPEAIVLASVILIIKQYWSAGPDQVLLFERSTRWGSGLTILLPLLFLTIGSVALILWTRRCWRITCHCQRNNVFQSALMNGYVDRLVTKIASGYMDLNLGVFNRLLSKFGFAAALIVPPVFMILPVYPFPNFFSSLEGNPTDIFLKAIFVALFAGLVLTLVRIWMVWGHVTNLLGCLAGHPIAKAFKRLDKSLIRGLNIRMTGSLPTLTEFQKSIDLLTPAISERFNVDRDEIASRYAQDLTDSSVKLRPPWSLMSKTQELLTDRAIAIIRQLNSYWARGGTADHHVRKAEDFIAFQLVNGLTYIFAQLRDVFRGAFFAGVCLLLATSCYPFYPQRLMMDVSWILLGVVTLTYLTILVQMDRNDLLNMVADHPVGQMRFDRPFKAQLGIYGLLPILWFLGTRFPVLGNVLFSWTSPLLKALNL